MLNFTKGKLTLILYHYNIITSYIYSQLSCLTLTLKPLFWLTPILVKSHFSEFYTSAPLYCKASSNICLHFSPICFFPFSLKHISVTKLFLSWLWRTFTLLNPMTIDSPHLIWPPNSIWHNLPVSPFQNNLLTLLVFLTQWLLLFCPTPPDPASISQPQSVSWV